MIAPPADPTIESPADPVIEGENMRGMTRAVVDEVRRGVPASRALAPPEAGFAEFGGVRVAYEVFGEGEETLLLLPPWSIVHSRFWKLQVPYLARHFRVITFDGRGNGRSDRPDSAGATTGPRVGAGDALAVLDATGHPPLRARRPLRGGRQRAAARGRPSRARPGRPLHVARPADHAAAARADRPPLRRAAAGVRGLGEGEPPLLGAGLPRLPGVLLRPLLSASRTRPSRSRTRSAGRSRPPRRRSRSRSRPPGLDEQTVRELLGRIRCPLLVTQSGRGPPDPARARRRLRRGDRRRARLARRGRPLPARAPPGAVQPAAARFRRARIRTRRSAHTAWRRAVRRPKRALYVSSPIGLGHAWRDVAIARELRALEPELEIDWLAQDPGHARARGVRRADPSREPRCSRTSRATSPPSRREHELNVFQALAPDGRDPARELHGLPRRRARGAYDLWIGDEAWELDHYLHENPELKTRRLLLPHRLRRLAADARGRRRRGAPDRRLQRRDDRADRALPARARPRDLRRQRRGRRPARLRRRAAADPALGGAALRLLRLRARARRGRAGRSRGAARRARLRARRARLPRHRRRVRRRRRTAATRDRGAPRGAAARPRSCAWSSSAARGSTPTRCRRHEGLEVVGYVHRLSATSPPATSPSSRAG